MNVPPRIYCIPATQAPIVAVFRRGPTVWSHIGRWNVRDHSYEPGAWLRGRVFPRRSDVSPDGRWLCYFAHKPSASWEHGDAYVAISKLPWLTALHAFGTCGTWTRGYCFTDKDRSESHGSVQLPISYGLRSIPVVQFATERRRGWMETADSPTRIQSDSWDVHRNARLFKHQPGGTRLLSVQRVDDVASGWNTDQQIDGMRVEYHLETDGISEPLPHLQWADWDHAGHLLAATRNGRLQIVNVDGGGLEVLFEHDLCSLEPSPGPAPDWAKRW